MQHLSPRSFIHKITRSRRRREEVRWFYGPGHTEEPRRQREDRKSLPPPAPPTNCSQPSRPMEPATCSKKPQASTSLRSSPTRRTPSPPHRLSLDVDPSTHPPSTCYEDAHIVDPSSPPSSKSPRSHTFPIVHKKRHKNRQSVDSAHSAASHDSYSTAHEEHGEGEGDGSEKHGILHKVATGMQKARPYVERLSGTYEPMPLKEPEHVTK